MTSFPKPPWRTVRRIFLVVLLIITVHRFRLAPTLDALIEVVTSAVAITEEFTEKSEK